MKLFALALLCMPALVHAQTLNNQISYNAATKAPVGAWADYVMTKEGEPDTVPVRYTLVQHDGKHIVIEIDSKTPIGRVLMRLEFGPDGSRWKLAKAKVKVGEGAAQDSPLPPDDRNNVFAKDDSFGDKVGRDPVTTPAGKRVADHFRRKTETWNTEVWIDDHVFPIGLVKLTDGQGGKVELAGTGIGGKSAF